MYLLSSVVGENKIKDGLYFSYGFWILINLFFTKKPKESSV